MAFCTHCGAQVPDGAKFCTSCGTPLTAPQAAPAPAQRPQPAAQRPQAAPQRPAPQAAPVPPAPQAAPQPKPFVEAPAEAGEFDLIQWDEPGSDTQPQPQPYAQAPQYAQAQPYAQQPQYAQPYPQQQPAGKPEKKKKPFFTRMIRLLLWLILIAILVAVGYYIYDNYIIFF